MLCPNCNTENVETAKFCNECGIRLDAALTQGEDAEGRTEPDAADGFEEEPDAEEADGSADGAPEIRLPEVEAGATAVLGSLPQLPVCDADATGVIAEPVAQRRAFWGSGGTLELPKVPVEPVDAFDAMEGSGIVPAEDGKVPPASDESVIPSIVPDKKKKKRSLLIALAAVLVIAAGVFGSYELELWGGHAVPDVTGMTQQSATDLLQEKGFTVRPMTVPSDDIEGIILLTDPEPGTRLADGSEVSIFAAVPRTIPDVVGKSQEEAAKALKDAGYEDVAVEKKKSNKKEGTVLAIDPEAGSEAKSTITVTLTVADPYRVPDVIGMSEGKAIKSVSKAGFEPDVDYSYSEEVDEGTVIGVEPEVGSVAKSGSHVLIIVAKSRATEVVELMWNILYEGREITVDGTSYVITEVNSVEYQGDDTASYSVTAEPFTYLLGERVTLDAREVTGTVTWSENNKIADSSPVLELG